MRLIIELTDQEYDFIRNNRNFLPMPLSQENMARLEKEGNIQTSSFVGIQTYVPNPAERLFYAYDRAVASQLNRLMFNVLFEDKEKELEFLTAKPLWQGIFNEGESIILASTAGVGKSLLSIEVAKNPAVKKVLFLTLEDYSRNQLPRYFSSGIEKQKIEVMSEQKWKEFTEGLKFSLRMQVDFFVKSTEKDYKYHELSRRRNEIYREFGIKEEKVLDNIMAFEILMEQVMFFGFDLVVIDSLNAIFEENNRITRNNLMRLVKAAQKKGITILFIHHLNKKGEISGTSELVNVVDSVYILSEIGNDPEKSESTLQIDVVKSRLHPSQKQTLTFIRKKETAFKATYERIERSPYVDKQGKRKDGLNPLESTLYDLFESSEHGITTKKEIEDFLVNENLDYNEGSINNALSKLKKKSLIRFESGSSWDGGIRFLTQTNDEVVPHINDDLDSETV